jgi:hypothetical protein
MLSVHLEAGPLRRDRAHCKLESWDGIKMVAVEWVDGIVRMFIFVLLMKTPIGGPRR